MEVVSCYKSPLPHAVFGLYQEDITVGCVYVVHKVLSVLLSKFEHVQTFYVTNHMRGFISP